MEFVEAFMTDEDRDLTRIAGQLLKVISQEDVECRTACSALLLALTLTFKEDTLFDRDQYMAFVSSAWDAAAADLPLPTSEVIAMSEYLRLRKEGDR